MKATVLLAPSAVFTDTCAVPNGTVPGTRHLILVALHEAYCGKAVKAPPAKRVPKVSGKVVISVPKRARLKAVRYEAGVLGPPLEVRVR